MLRFVRAFLLATPCAALLLAQGCGGSSSSDSQAALTVALADTPSDDVTSFSLTVKAISLTSSTGAVHTAMATPIVVDLATLSSFSQVVDLGLLDPAMYTTGSVTVDFTNAACFLAGKTTAAALVDDQGVALTGSMTLPLDFTAAPFTAVAGHHHVLELDFDFNQMLSVDLAGNSVEVVPTIAARFDRSNQNALVCYGEGISLNLTQATGTMELESLARVQLRQMAIDFDANAVYHVNGTAFLGAAGLSMLGSQPIGTWFQAFGVAEPGFQRITITYIEAGKGTWNGGQDFVDGYVVDRAGAAGADPAFTVIGFSSNAAHTTLRYNTTFTVDASFASTHVVSRGNSSAFTSDAINVGQRIQAYGALALTTLDATAATGIARGVATTLSGTSVGAFVASPLTLDLQRVGPLDQGLFIWGDGGIVPPVPTAFTVNVGTLANGLTIINGTPLVVSANLAAVDSAVEDATATFVTDVTSGPVLLSLRDRANGFTVATDTSGGQIRFTITGVEGADETATLDSGFQGVVALPTAPDPTIVAAATQSLYVIFHAATKTSTSFTVYTDFVTALGTALAGTETLRQFAASGDYDAVHNVFGAQQATAVLQ